MNSVMLTFMLISSLLLFSCKANRSMVNSVQAASNYKVKTALKYELRLMTFNLWMGTKFIPNGIEETARIIKAAKSNLVFIQEGDEATKKVATLLGYKVVTKGKSPGILSSFELTPLPLNDRAIAALLTLPSGEQMIAASIHLKAFPYGPYEACFEHKNEKEIYQMEKKVRLEEAQVIMALISMWQKILKVDEVIIGGDFNTPSHFDWVEETKESHCQMSFNYPVSKMLQDKGYRDLYRLQYPDPKTHPGNTWSPRELFNLEHQLPEPQDRIDQLYYKGKNWQVNFSEVVFTGDLVHWPSDHAAVRAHLVRP